LNYRHAFHAGNFADCMKHALLVVLMRSLLRKPASLFVLDTHAGRGHYDLDTGPAARTNESADGIRRLLQDTPGPLEDYVALVRGLGLYPGSPELVRALLRPDDRLACCELHPEEYAELRQRFRRDPRVAVHRRDAWEALKALLPPAERKRGLILIDPPYEDPAEYTRLAAGLTLAHQRFRGGVIAAWYPAKRRASIRAFFDALSLRDVVAAELLLREPIDPSRLNGCGMLIVNPPYRFEEEARPIMDSLLDRLGSREPGEAATIIRLADE
jgi:23S rRNA (adenine2030-N6)-methyltransferase